MLKYSDIPLNCTAAGFANPHRHDYRLVAARPHLGQGAFPDSAPVLYVAPDGDNARDGLVPERALAGDGHARRTLASEIYPALAANKELLETCVGFLDCGSSMEATARALFVHPNTVRYRLKRISEVTTYSPTDPREGYVLRLALTLGRLRDLN